MSTLESQIIEKNGKKEFAVLAYADFLRIQEDLEDYEDLRCLREAKATDAEAPTIGLAELRRRLKGPTTRSGGSRRRAR